MTLIPCEFRRNLSELDKVALTGRNNNNKKNDGKKAVSY